MKRLLLFLMLFVTVSSFAINTHRYNYIGYAYSQKIYNENTKTWSKWSSIVPTSIKIIVDYSENIIIIFSNKIQLYKIIDKDTILLKDDISYKMTVVDIEGDNALITLYNKQLYIEYANLMWVYNLKQIVS